MKAEPLSMGILRFSLSPARAENAGPRGRKPRIEMLKLDSIDILGRSCIMRCFDRGSSIETWDASFFWKDPRCWLTFPRCETRQKAIEAAEFILSDRERCGAYMMGEAARRLKEASNIEEYKQWTLENPESLARIVPDIKDK